MSGTKWEVQVIHRDYLIDSQIRIFIYDDRVEIISPGHLPNNLTTEKIKSGNVVLRNPILASYVAKGILPYHGLGTGIRRSLDACPDIILDDDRDGDRFTVIIPRKNTGSLVSVTDWEKDISRAEKPASMSEDIARVSEEISEKRAFVSEKPTSVSEKILEILRKDPASTARGIAEQLQISSRTVERHLAVLRQEGHIHRLGPTKGGSWGLR